MLEILVTLLANPAVQTALGGLFATAITWLAARIGLRWLSEKRAGIITKVVIKVVSELTLGASKDQWPVIVAMAMKMLFDELTADPALKVKPEEVESLHPFVSALVKRKLGIVDKPMVADVKPPRMVK